MEIKNEAIFEAVCAEFHDNYFEDKWSEISDASIVKFQTRHAMRKAMNKLWSFAPKNNKQSNPTRESVGEK